MASMSEQARDYTVLIVEDEPTLAKAIAQRMEASEGWKTHICGDGASAVATAAALKPDLIIMDIMLPVMDGLEAMRRITAVQTVPVIILTARDDEIDKLIGLNAGADDYMTKPFSMRELIARCKTIKRRVERAQIIAQAPAAPQALEYGDLTIDPVEHTVVYQGKPVHLTPVEFDLLYTLAKEPRKVFSRDKLLEDVWKWDDAANGDRSTGTRTVDSHVRGLRLKLNPSIIRTVHGVGYAFEPPAGA